MTIDRDNARALITDTRTWIRLHRENKFQAEAAKRMARLADALESALSAVPVGGEIMRDESLSEALTRLRADAERLGAVHVTAGLDQIDARLNAERDRVLREHFTDGGPTDDQ